MVKWAGRVVVDHQKTPCAKRKNEWNYVNCLPSCCGQDNRRSVCKHYPTLTRLQLRRYKTNAEFNFQSLECNTIFGDVVRSLFLIQRVFHIIEK